MTCEEFLEFCRNIPGASVDQPFDGDFETYVARHTLSRKWFALVMIHEGRHIVNLKCDPQEADLLRKLFNGVVPAYHMNKTYWNTIILNSDLPDEEIKRMTMNSFALTDKRK